MRDFDDGHEQYDEAEVFENTCIHLGISQIYALFRLRAAHSPAMEDRDFIPMIEALIEPFKEFLSPEGLEELWNNALWDYFEYRKELNPKAKRKQCEEQMLACLLAPRPQALPPPVSSAVKKKRPRK